MKKIIYQLVPVLAVVLSFSSSFAQQAYQPTAAATTENATLLNDNVPNGSATTSSTVEAKVIRSFNKHFKNVDNQKWYLINQDYLASFPVKDRQALAWFRKNGQMTHAVYYGFEKHLPEIERKMIESNYEDYSIGATQEIHSVSGTAWVATLENSKSIVKVKITDNGLEEMERIKKSN